MSRVSPLTRSFPPTLSEASRRHHGTTTAALKALNKLPNDTIFAGQHLKLPPPAYRQNRRRRFRRSGGGGLQGRRQERRR